MYPFSERQLVSVLSALACFPVYINTMSFNNGKVLQITKFKQDSNMVDYFCADDIIFSGNNEPSLSTCVQLCDLLGNGVIYNELTGRCQCHGNSNTSSLSCDLEQASGYRFYFRADVSYIILKTQTTVNFALSGPALFYPIWTQGPAILPAVISTTTMHLPLTSASYSVPPTSSSTSKSPVVTTSSAAVTSTINPDEWRFRLVNGTQKSGRLEVYHNGTWGVVYGFSVSLTDATIICRDIMNISRFGFPIYGDYFGEGAFKAGLSKDLDTEYDILCYSNATCNDYMWKAEGDSDFEEFSEFGTIGLDCTDDNLKVQLADGLDSKSGRLEVMLLDTWGTVCGDDDWEDGPMFCRYFGLNYTTFEIAGNTTTIGPVWIHGSLYDCDSENATTPTDCEWSPYTKEYFNSSCTHNSDVILYCQ